MSRSSSTAEQVEPPAPVLLRAPLFGALSERMLAGDRWVVQDLGPAQSGMVSFCNRFRCRLDIIDLPAELAGLNDEEDPGRRIAHAERLFAEPDRPPADIVLCWDLLNYLQRPALTAVMDCVAARAKPDCLVHALIVYSTTQMPVSPGRYSPWRDPDAESDHVDQLLYLPATDEQCDAPRYTPDDLAHCLRGFRVERAILLNNGMQEFLFRL